MKKLLLVIGSLIVFLIPTSGAIAQNNNPQMQNIVIQKGEVVEHDYFAGGNSVTISGTVNGDVYAAGGNILVDGVINGDLIAVGGTIDIIGEVKNNLRVAGGNVTINGKIGSNILVGSGNLIINKDSQIGGSLIAGAGTVDINTPLNKTIWLGSGQVRINAPVRGDVNAGTSDLILGSNAAVSGNVTYWNYSADKPASLLAGATVSGQLKREIIQKQASPQFLGVMTGFGLVLKIIKLFGLFILGLLLLRFFPKKTLAVSNLLTTDWLRNLGLGLVTVLLSGFIGVVLLFSVIGLSLGFLVFFILGMGLYLSEVFISLWLGRKLFTGLDQTSRYGWALLVGIVVYEVITLLPIIGWLVRVVAALIGLGAMLLVKKATYQELKAKL